MVIATLAGGCAFDSAASFDTEDYIDMDPPPSNCSAGTTASPCPAGDSSGNPVGGPCIDSDDCLGEAACVAPYSDGEVGDFTCTDQCLPLEDPTSWCFDAASCCDPAASCRRGLCVLDPAVDESGSGPDGGDSGSSSDSGGSSGTGGSSDSGSDSGSGDTSPGGSSGSTGMP